MSDGKQRGPEHAFDPGASVPAPEPRKRTAEDKAVGAKTIAENLGRHSKLVSDSVAAMTTAAAAEDRAGWTTAKQAADAGVTQIRTTVEAALAALPDATDAQVRERLAGVEQLLTAATTLVAGAPAAPEIRVPVMSCAAALLAVLPPDSPATWAEPVFAPAARAVETIFKNQMTSSDITAFATIREEHKDHEIARRFGRFGEVRQNKLLNIFKDPKVRAHARELEAARQRSRGIAPVANAPLAPVAGDAPAANAQLAPVMGDAPAAKPIPRLDLGPSRATAPAANAQPFTGAHEAFAEVRKYEAMIRGRMTDMVSQLGHGGTAGTAAASRIENEILVMEGELSHWRGVLEDVKHTGDPRLARGLIEAKDIGKVTDEAIAAGYPALPSNQYHYRRWPQPGGPEGQEFQVIRADASGPDAMLQPRRHGNGWVLEETEGTGKVPKSFEAALSDDHVFRGVFAESPSLRAYIAALTDPHGIALQGSSVHARSRKAIERVRTPRGATVDEVAAGARQVIDEDNLRHALKVEFREEFFACAAREPTAEAQLARFRDITKDLNSKDRSNLVEDFLARRDPGSVQQVAVKQADHPHLGLTAKERHIDRVRPDGTAVEVKSLKGKFSTDDLAQLDDYQKMVRAKITVQVAGKPVKIQRAMYELTEPAGVRANLTKIQEEMLGKGISVKVYNQSGHARILENKKDLVGIEEWLAR